MISEEDRIDSFDNLALANGVRLHYSQVRQQHWLLFPEGAIALNASAVAILAFCDGHNSLYAITTALKRHFKNVEESDVKKLLAQMMQRGLLVIEH